MAARERPTGKRPQHGRGRQRRGGTTGEAAAAARARVKRARRRPGLSENEDLVGEVWAAGPYLKVSTVVRNKEPPQIYIRGGSELRTAAS